MFFKGFESRTDFFFRRKTINFFLNFPYLVYITFKCYQMNLFVLFLDFIMIKYAQFKRNLNFIIYFVHVR